MPSGAWPLSKMNPFVLTKHDPGDAHLCVDFFPLVVEMLVVGSLWTLWAGPKDSSTSPSLAGRISLS